MVANNSPDQPNASRKSQIWPILNLLLTAVLLAVGLWYISQRVTLAELAAAFASANSLFILLSFLSMVLTLVIKSWRWQILLTQEPAAAPELVEPVETNGLRQAPTPAEQTRPSFTPLFWAFNLGAYINLVLPFMRMGEIARIFAVDWTAHVGKARALGTIVVEKILDLIMLGLTLLLVLPFVVLPGFIDNPLPMITAVSLICGFILYILAFQTKWVINVSRLFASWLPPKWEERTMRWLISGLEGLDALRNKRQTLVIIALSAFIAFMSVLTPYLLFPAFHLNLGVVQAALLTILVTLAITPPSTPGQIGVLNGTAALILVAFGIHNEAIIVSYSTIYYFVIVLPVIGFGGLAVSRTQWKWQKSPNS
jgi:hypothetical protein